MKYKNKKTRFRMLLTLALVLLFTAVPQALANDVNRISTSDIITLVEGFENNGEFTSGSAARALTMHLTAVKHFEQQGENIKVVEHMNSFKLLLNHQLDNELINENAYDALMDNTDALILRWDDLTIIQDGQARAVVILDDEAESTRNAPPAWARWGNPNPGGTVERSENTAHTGAASMLINGMESGGVWQHIDVEAGTISAQLHYYTEADSTHAGLLNIGMNLRDANLNNLTSIRSDRVTLSDTSGEWAVVTLEGEIPETVDGVKVARAQLTITVTGGENTEVYVDDYLVHQHDNNLNLVENPGFETIDNESGNTFVDYVEESTGVTLPIYLAEPNLDNDEVVNIYIGHSRLEDAARHQSLLQDMNEHGFIIDAHDGHITILGTTPRATEYGVSEFLERYVGIRWLMPGPDGVHIPQLDTIKIPQGLVQEEPASISRYFYGMGLGGSAPYEWAMTNRFHENVVVYHNLNRLFDPEVFADHPEYYPGGVVPTHAFSWQPCFNDTTADVAIQRIIEYFDERPDANSYSLAINDSSNYCEDEEHPDYPNELNSIGKVHRSDLYFPWVNRIVEGVTEVYPDKYFGLLAYSSMFDPPKNEDGSPYRLHPNVIPYITDDRMAWGDPMIEAKGKTNTEGWAEVTDNLGFYEYLYGAQYNVPRVYFQQMAENYQYGHEHGVVAHVAELYPNWGEGPKPWVSAKLQWNPNQDVDKLLNDWYVSAVGEAAAPYLRQYYEHWEHFWSQTVFESEWYQVWANADSRSSYLTFNDQRYLLAITKEDVATARNLIEQSVAHAGTDEQKTRAEILLRSFELYEAAALSYPYNEPVDAPADEQAALEMLEDIKISIDMAAKRYALMEEFTGHPVLDVFGRPRGEWNGVQRFHFNALMEYVENEPEDGPVRDLVDQFLADLPENLRQQFLDEIPDVTNLSANAIKTSASKEDILQTLDFSQGPWTDAEPFNEFLIMNTTGTPPVETKVYLLWDDENLYVGYENFDPDPDGMTISEEAPNGWWRSGADDSVETFITDDPIQPFLGFFTNPIAVGFSRYQSGFEPVQWESNAHIAEDRWNAIQVIPFASIHVNPDHQDTLMGFFFRNYHGSNSFLGWGGGNPWNPQSFKPVHLVE